MATGLVLDESKLLLDAEQICRSGFPPDESPIYRFYDTYLIYNHELLEGWQTAAREKPVDWADAALFQRDWVGKEAPCERQFNLKLALKFKYRQTFMPVKVDEDHLEYPYTRGELIKSLTLLPSESVELEFRTSRVTELFQKTVSRIEDKTSYSTESKTDSAVEVTNALDKSTTRTVEAKASASWGWGSASAGASYQDQVDEHFSVTRSESKSELIKTNNEVSNSRTIEISVTDELTSSSRNTRTFQNPNRCHSLTYNYYYVDRHYLVTTKVCHVDLVLLVENQIACPHPLSEYKIDWDHDMFRLLRFSNNYRFMPSDIRNYFEELMSMYEESSVSSRRKDRLEMIVAGWAFDHKTELMHENLLDENAQQRFIRMREHKIVDSDGNVRTIWDFCENLIEGFFGEYTAFPIKRDFQSGSEIALMVANAFNNNDVAALRTNKDFMLKFVNWLTSKALPPSQNGNQAMMDDLANGLISGLAKLSSGKDFVEKLGVDADNLNLDLEIPENSWEEKISMPSLSEVAMGAVEQCSVCERNSQVETIVGLTDRATQIETEQAEARRRQERLDNNERGSFEDND